MKIISTIDEYAICRIFYEADRNIAHDIIALQEYLPPYLRESRERIIANFRDERSIHMILLNQHLHEVSCYMFACPQDERVVGDFVSDDPLMPLCPQQYYIDQIVSKKHLKKGLLFAKLAFALFDEANNMGIERFAVHALRVQGLDVVLRRIYRKFITKTRDVVLPTYGNEKYLYMEALYRGK